MTNNYTTSVDLFFEEARKKSEAYKNIIAGNIEPLIEQLREVLDKKQL
ncbi:28288_t:CDS:1, partial [Dentiscutata erythropus]